MWATRTFEQWKCELCEQYERVKTTRTCEQCEQQFKQCEQCKNEMITPFVIVRVSRCTWYALLMYSKWRRCRLWNTADDCHWNHGFLRATKGLQIGIWMIARVQWWPLLNDDHYRMMTIIEWLSVTNHTLKNHVNRGDSWKLLSWSQKYTFIGSKYLRNTILCLEKEITRHWYKALWHWTTELLLNDLPNMWKRDTFKSKQGTIPCCRKGVVLERMRDSRRCSQYHTVGDSSELDSNCGTHFSCRWIADSIELRTPRAEVVVR